MKGKGPATFNEMIEMGNNYTPAHPGVYFAKTTPIHFYTKNAAGFVSNVRPQCAGPQRVVFSTRVF